jgi:hypothetical protein
MEYTDTEPLREFARRRGFSPTTVYSWSDKGLIKTFLMGGRRHVVLSSYGELVKRLITEQGDAKLGSPNPRLRRERNDARQPHSEFATQSQVSERGDPACPITSGGSLPGDAVVNSTSDRRGACVTRQSRSRRNARKVSPTCSSQANARPPPSSPSR